MIRLVSLQQAAGPDQSMQQAADPGQSMQQAAGADQSMQQAADPGQSMQQAAGPGRSMQQAADCLGVGAGVQTRSWGSEAIKGPLSPNLDRLWPQVQLVQPSSDYSRLNNLQLTTWHNIKPRCTVTAYRGLKKDYNRDRKS